MKKLIILLSIVAIGLASTKCRSGKAGDDSAAFPFKTFEINRGTNLAHWLSQSRTRGEQRAMFITERDIRFIDSVGFDHVRLPIDEEQMWDENGNREEEAFTLMKNCLDWCQEAGLRVIIDLHILRSHHFNEAEKPLWTVPAEQDKFIGFWKDLSDFLKDYPLAMVAYEPMNEPVADDPEQWNQLLERVIDSIRVREPARVIVMGSNMWQSANTFDQLRVPEGDTNIVLSYHFYEPFFLTHYKAGWTNLKDFEAEVNYPGKIILKTTVLPEAFKSYSRDELEYTLNRVYNRDTLEYMMRKPFQLAAKLNLPLYCGEFGVYLDYFPAAKLAWYRDMISIFEEHNVAYANWNYKSNAFGVVDNNGDPIQPYLNAVLGKE